MRHNNVLTKFLFGFTVLTMAVLFAGLFCFPQFMSFYCGYTERPEAIIPGVLRAYYFVTPPTLVGLGFLCALLRNIIRGQVFEKKNVMLLRNIGLLAFVAALFCGVFGYRYLPVIICGVAGLFVSLILAVLAELFAVACRIKDENELTI
ncbi:MAG: DUF2975 domain-containing protein [Ruminococcaceae bacterium]|nr:DUF2975 domain-containing protein [Oscillospiraceae bacterium]